MCLLTSSKTPVQPIVCMETDSVTGSWAVIACEWRLSIWLHPCIILEITLRHPCAVLYYAVVGGSSSQMTANVVTSAQLSCLDIVLPLLKQILDSSISYRRIDERPFVDLIRRFVDLRLQRPGWTLGSEPDLQLDFSSSPKTTRVPVIFRDSHATKASCLS